MVILCLKILERECMVSTSTHPDASIQLTHAATQLRTPAAYSKTITPHSSHWILGLLNCICLHKFKLSLLQFICKWRTHEIPQIIIKYIYIRIIMIQLHF